MRTVESPLRQFSKYSPGLCILDAFGIIWGGGGGGGSTRPCISWAATVKFGVRTAHSGIKGYLKFGERLSLINLNI